jgi:general secretion pathway protein G
MIVMTLIVILAGMGLALYTNSVTRAKEAVLKEDLFRMRDALDQYYADQNQYPATLEALVVDGYLRAVPADPFTESTETWQAIMSFTGRVDLSTQPGVYDVQSGAEQTALDGTAYAEW